MVKEKLGEIFSLNGISILIGIVGGIVGLLSIFIDWNAKLSIKWFALLWIICSFMMLILGKLVFELYKSHSHYSTNPNKVIKYSATESLLLLEKTGNLEIMQSVSLSYIKNNFQLPLADGFVQNVQDKFVQVKIIAFDQEFQSSYDDDITKIINNDSEALNSILIKNYIKYNG